MIMLNRNGNTINIILTDEEEETLDYMGIVFLQQQIDTLFRGRKLQQEEEMRRAITNGLSRDQLKAELARKNNV